MGWEWGLYWNAGLSPWEHSHTGRYVSGKGHGTPNVAWEPRSQTWADHPGKLCVTDHASKSTHQGDTTKGASKSRDLRTEGCWTLGVQGLAVLKGPGLGVLVSQRNWWALEVCGCAIAYSTIHLTGSPLGTHLP